MGNFPTVSTVTCRSKPAPGVGGLEFRFGAALLQGGSIRPGKVRWDQMVIGSKWVGYFTPRNIAFIWANYNDVSRRHPKWWFNKGTSPKSP